MTAASRSINEHLEAALESATDEAARYHIRQALQLRIVEAEWDEEELTV